MLIMLVCCCSSHSFVTFLRVCFLAWNVSHPCFAQNYTVALKKLRAEFLAFAKALFHGGVPISRRGWREMFWKLLQTYEDKVKILPLHLNSKNCPISVIFSEASRGFKKLLKNATPDAVTLDVVDWLFQVTVSCVNKLLGAQSSKKQKGLDGNPTSRDRLRDIAGDIFGEMRQKFEQKQDQSNFVRVKTGSLKMPEKDFSEFRLSDLAPKFSSKDAPTTEVPNGEWLKSLVSSDAGDAAADTYRSAGLVPN